MTVCFPPFLRGGRMRGRQREKVSGFMPSFLVFSFFSFLFFYFRRRVGDCRNPGSEMENKQLFFFFLFLLFFILSLIAYFSFFLLFFSSQYWLFFLSLLDKETSIFQRDGNGWQKEKDSEIARDKLEWLFNSRAKLRVWHTGIYIHLSLPLSFVERQKK